MKLVIEIPKEQYNLILKSDTNSLLTANSLFASNYANAIKNGTPLADVLEGVKAKIETLDFDWGDDLSPTSRSTSMVCDAIDECIEDYFDGEKSEAKE